VTDEELRDALNGLYAYDTGSLDSGIHDEALRSRCIDELRHRTGPHDLYPRLFIGRMVRDLYLSEEALTEGYGPEDAYEFIRWLDDRMR